MASCLYIVERCLSLDSSSQCFTLCVSPQLILWPCHVMPSHVAFWCVSHHVILCCCGTYTFHGVVPCVTMSPFSSPHPLTSSPPSHPLPIFWLYIQRDIVANLVHTCLGVVADVFHAVLSPRLTISCAVSCVSQRRWRRVVPRWRWWHCWPLPTTAYSCRYAKPENIYR